MEDEYDLTKMKSRLNPYARQLREQVTLRLRPDTVEYFKKLAEETGEDYLTLIDLYLADCAARHQRPPALARQ
ncbi:MAG: antitoxin [Candidatus Brocadiae bacterium]|nr:antitoxin [Candidatus Brocadiia bacterium]